MYHSLRTGLLNPPPDRGHTQASCNGLLPSVGEGEAACVWGAPRVQAARLPRSQAVRGLWLLASGAQPVAPLARIGAAHDSLPRGRHGWNERERHAWMHHPKAAGMWASAPGSHLAQSPVMAGAGRPLPVCVQAVAVCGCAGRRVYQHGSPIISTVARLAARGDDERHMQGSGDARWH